MSALKELASTGTAFSGKCNLHAISLASTNGATSGIGKLELRDGASGPVLLTLRVPQDNTVPWASSRKEGVQFLTGIHATISGAGAGILATFEYTPG